MAFFGSHGDTEDIKITQSGSVQNLPKESSEFRKTAREYCEQNLALCWPAFLAPFWSHCISLYGFVPAWFHTSVMIQNCKTLLFVVLVGSVAPPFPEKVCNEMQRNAVGVTHCGTCWLTCWFLIGKDHAQWCGASSDPTCTSWQRWQWRTPVPPKRPTSWGRICNFEGLVGRREVTKLWGSLGWNICNLVLGAFGGATDAFYIKTQNVIPFSYLLHLTSDWSDNSTSHGSLALMLLVLSIAVSNWF